MEPIRLRKKYPLLVAAMASAVWTLGGCGGGGKTNVRPDPPQPQPPIVTAPRAIEGAAPVTIGVVDRDFRITHQDFEGRLAGVWNVVTQSDAMTNENMGGADDPRNHGTPVASVAAGNTWGVAADASLRLVRVGHPGSFSRFDHVREGIIHSAEHGDRVINLSFGSNSFANGPDHEETARALTAAADGRGSLLVQSAGNSGEPITLHTIAHPEVLDHYLMVGGSSGYNKHPDSVYPGADPTAQSRWLVAPYWATGASNGSDTASGRFWGTSFAAPRVAGMAGVLFAQWPHLTAAEVSGRLLETADRTSSLYADNTCGESGDRNCGYYYLGQGHADLDAALAPMGEMMTPAGGQVDGAEHALEHSYAQWSRAFGRDFTTDLFADAVAFDRLGRDYRVDLQPLQGRGTGHGQRVFERMEAQLAYGFPGTERTEELVPGLTLQTRQHADGTLVAGRIDATQGAFGFSVFGFERGQQHPLNAGFVPDGMGLLNDAGAAWVDDLDAVTGIATHWDLHDTLQLRAEHWTGAVDTSGVDALFKDYGVHRQEVALTVRSTPNLHWTLGQAIIREENGLLGTRGTGALNLGDGHQLNETRIGVAYRLGEPWSLRADYAQGRGRMQGGDGLIRAIDGLRTEQASVALHWNQGPHQAALVAHQPLRVTAGRAMASVPVGRTVDGEVLRETRSASLDADGRQTDLELAYRYAPTPRTRFNLNLLYSDQPDHDRAADAEIAGFASVQVRF